MIVSTALEFTAVILLILAFKHEDKFIAFEDSIIKKIKERVTK